jgi:hypothetical protein
VPGDGLPTEIEILRSNNNLDTAVHEGKIFLAFRSAPTHFASPKARIYVISSEDGAKTWTYEATFARGRDVREPRLLAWNGRLFLYFFQAGTSPFSFSPERIYATERLGPREWSEPRPISEPGYVVWRTKVMRGPKRPDAAQDKSAKESRPLMVRYGGGGEMYSVAGGHATLGVELLTTDDGFDWRPIDETRPVVYTGGGSEADFAFDADGVLWAVIRNEAGDSGGWGSKICTAPPDSPADWECTDDRRKFDSPLVFEHRGEVYLIARRNLAPWAGGDFDLGWRFLPRTAQWLAYELSYWITPKRTALYWIDRAQRTAVHIADLPSKGDTAFPALLEQDEDSYLVFNYSSDIDGIDKPWIVGQLTPTAIYATELRFLPPDRSG